MLFSLSNYGLLVLGIILRLPLTCTWSMFWELKSSFGLKVARKGVLSWSWRYVFLTPEGASVYTILFQVFVIGLLWNRLAWIWKSWLTEFALSRPWYILAGLVVVCVCELPSTVHCWRLSRVFCLILQRQCIMCLQYIQRRLIIIIFLMQNPIHLSLAPLHVHISWSHRSLNSHWLGSCQLAARVSQNLALTIHRWEALAASNVYGWFLRWCYFQRFLQLLSWICLMFDNCDWVKCWKWLEGSVL